MKVLITAPSLDENSNVSGISTMVRNLIESRRFDFSHFEAGRRDGEAADAAWFGKQAMLPFRFFARIKIEDPAIVHINTAFIPLAIVRDVSLAAAAKLARKPVVLHVHGGPFVMEKITSTALKTAVRSLLRLTKVTVVFSDRERHALESNFPVTNIRVLPNGIQVDKALTNERVSGREKTFIFFGRLHPSKGLEHIVAACRVLTEQGFKFRYVCYGAGPELESFVTQMNNILGERFSYRGIARFDQKHHALAEADIFFQPSRDEGLPLALLEAMSAGCVPVMSESGAVGDVIKDGYNGFLIDANDTLQTIGKLKVLLTDGNKRWHELRTNAVETVRTKFSFDRFMDGLAKIYNEIK
ncbi:MAG: glycosyltransferase family 4 protein [Pyrinomonadaceae bacterium]